MHGEEASRLREAGSEYGAKTGRPRRVGPLDLVATRYGVGVQAATNVLLGERYKSIGKEVKAYLRGEYGRAPGEVNAELQKKVLGDDQPITCRFADTLEPVFEKTKAELGARAKNDEDVLSYISFPQVAEKFFADREAAAEKGAERPVKYKIELIG